MTGIYIAYGLIATIIAVIIAVLLYVLRELNEIEKIFIQSTMNQKYSQQAEQKDDYANQEIR